MFPDQVLDRAERSSKSNVSPHKKLDPFVAVPDSGDGLVMGFVDSRSFQSGSRHVVFVGSERQRSADSHLGIHRPFDDRVQSVLCLVRRISRNRGLCDADVLPDC